MRPRKGRVLAHSHRHDCSTEPPDLEILPQALEVLSKPARAGNACLCMTARKAPLQPSRGPSEFLEARPRGRLSPPTSDGHI